MPSQTSSVEQINEWHLQNGWNGVGYHYVIRRNGDIERGRTLEVVGAHCLNHNLHSIGICYEGGLDDKGQPADTRTKEQKRAICQLLVDLKKNFPRRVLQVTTNSATKHVLVLMSQNTLTSNQNQISCICYSIEEMRLIICESHFFVVSLRQPGIVGVIVSGHSC